jgi:hypothetical protein
MVSIFPRTCRGWPHAVGNLLLVISAKGRPRSIRRSPIIQLLLPNCPGSLPHCSKEIRGSQETVPRTHASSAAHAAGSILCKGPLEPLLDLRIQS